MTDFNKFVTIVEVGPRDGLQNEKTFIPTETKIQLIDRLSHSGLKRIEATSFVSPKWIPQLSDAAEVMAGIQRVPGVSYSVLTPNLRGFEAAVTAGANEVAIFASASETFSQKNINCSIDESLERFRPVAAAAERAGIALRGYVSCVAECPYEGPIAPMAVAIVTNKLLDMGCHEVSLGDTIGRGHPDAVESMLDVVLNTVPVERLAGHFHDTGGRASDNIVVALQKGIRTFDSAIGGLGGCPYAPGAAGNVDTVKVITLVHGLGYDTGVDAASVMEAASFVNGRLRPFGRVTSSDRSS
jgi:hydroxymethylglutaryl-CoA lyase